MNPSIPDPAFEISLRPPMFSEFTGQEKVCERIAVLVEAAKKRGDVLEHILLSGQPGWGKRPLAHILTNTVAVHLQKTIGHMTEKADHLPGLPAIT